MTSPTPEPTITPAVAVKAILGIRLRWPEAAGTRAATEGGGCVGGWAVQLDGLATALRLP